MGGYFFLYDRRVLTLDTLVSLFPKGLTENRERYDRHEHVHHTDICKRYLPGETVKPFVLLS